MCLNSRVSWVMVVEALNASSAWDGVGVFCFTMPESQVHPHVNPLIKWRNGCQAFDIIRYAFIFLQIIFTSKGFDLPKAECTARTNFWSALRWLFYQFRADNSNSGGAFLWSTLQIPKRVHESGEKVGPELGALVGLALATGRLEETLLVMVAMWMFSLVWLFMSRNREVTCTEERPAPVPPRRLLVDEEQPALPSGRFKHLKRRLSSQPQFNDPSPGPLNMWQPGPAESEDDELDVLKNRPLRSSVRNAAVQCDIEGMSCGFPKGSIFFAPHGCRWHALKTVSAWKWRQRFPTWVPVAPAALLKLDPTETYNCQVFVDSLSCHFLRCFAVWNGSCCQFRWWFALIKVMVQRKASPSRPCWWKCI